MTRPENIDLAVGGNGWLQLWRLLIGILGAAVVLTSATTVAWKIILTGALGLAFAASAISRRREDAIDRLRLRADGSALLIKAGGTVQAQLCGSGWSSRWCCVVPLAETPGRRHFRCLVCSSRNSADAYRRLLVQLRLSAAAEPEPGVRST